MNTPTARIFTPTPAPGLRVTRESFLRQLKQEDHPRISLADLGREPYRAFFPAGVLAGILGVLLWPLYFGHVIAFYPNIGHPRIMACGMFGAFIFGFLGTAMPRMLSAKALRAFEVLPLLALHIAMVVAFAVGSIFIGDALFLTLLAGFAVVMTPRIQQRADNPPPGFALVAMAFLCVASGAALAVLDHYRELDPRWVMLQRLLSYQGFVLLPILGIGPFILPRFLGMQSAHDLPDGLSGTRAWKQKAIRAVAAGLLVIASFFIEAFGSYRLAYGLRFATTLLYFILEMPLAHGPKANHAFGASIRISLLGIVAGFLAVAILPAYRVSLLHLTLVGGFAVITFVVATRVVFGHSGRMDLLKGKNRWLLIAIGLMLFGMATRMSGDFLPRIMASHYVYGAISWTLGVVLWSIYVLPKVLLRDPEG